MATLRIGRAKEVMVTNLEVARYGSGEIVYFARDPKGRKVWFKLYGSEVDKTVALINRRQDLNKVEPIATDPDPCPGFEQAPGSIGCRHCRKWKKDHSEVT